MEEKKKAVPEGEASLPVQELPADIPAEVRQKLAEDLNEQATEDLKQDVRDAEKEEAKDEEVKAPGFGDALVGLLEDPARLSAMRAAAKGLGQDSAAAALADQVESASRG